MSKTEKNPTTSSDDHLLTLTTKSSKIRYLASQGMKKGDIARKLNIRYQHVRNVLITPLTGKKD